MSPLGDCNLLSSEMDGRNAMECTKAHANFSLRRATSSTRLQETMLRGRLCTLLPQDKNAEPEDTPASFIRKRNVHLLDPKHSPPGDSSISIQRYMFCRTTPPGDGSIRTAAYFCEILPQEKPHSF
mmetsp:Transcript_35850/g.78493  ORF Transcript_35850/g.78493 Transcript_35850/m.78493 type:complete len:126 (-) Transcript_35850:18-395(-)